MTSPLTLQAKYDQLVERIVEANDRGNWYPNTCGCDRCSYCQSPKTLRDITLEDVAITIQETSDYFLHDSVDGGRSVGEILWDIWHLGKPLSEQPNETIDFLHSLCFPSAK